MLYITNPAAKVPTVPKESRAIGKSPEGSASPSLAHLLQHWKKIIRRILVQQQT